MRVSNLAVNQVLFVLIWVLSLTPSSLYCADITYEYDERNRLISAAYNDLEKTTVLAYQYDPAGNLTQYVVTVKIPQAGDVNFDTGLSLADSILALQIAAGMAPAGTVTKKADVSGDGVLGVAESVFIIRTLAGF